MVRNWILESCSTMENVEDVESESGQLDCLDVPSVTGQVSLPVVVLRKVLENLSSADLLNLSLVNKEWNYETRSVLRDRGSLTARMNTDDGSCKDLRAFASDLRRMREVRKVVPFSGLTMTVSGAEKQHGDWCNASSTEEMDQVYEEILHQMEWKHLALRLTHHWDRKKNCAGFQMVKKILHKCSGRLEEFSLNIESNHEAFNQHFLQDCNFSRLEALKFQGRYRVGDEALIKLLVARAPNLKVLCTIGCLDLRANLLEGSSAEHVYDHPYWLPSGAFNISESILGKLRLRRIKLSTSEIHFTLERFNMVVPMFLLKSRTTLSSIEVEAELLMLLMQYGICLENVRALTVAFYCCLTPQPRLWRLMKTLDFTRIFPNLRSVQIVSYQFPKFGDTLNAVMDLVEQGNAALIQPVNRSVCTKEVSLYWDSSIPDSFYRFLVEMFPHIEKLVIEAREFPLVHFWDYWLDLEELDITLILQVLPGSLEYLESAFCGIFPEEVAELRKRGEEYLQKVNIVPVMPSLACLKRLKTFNLYFDGWSSDSVHPTSILSKVSGLIAFKRRPNLTVTLATNTDRWKRELQHMEPYASVRLIDRS